jgi:hypothetical protein
LFCSSRLFARPLGRASNSAAAGGRRQPLRFETRFEYEHIQSTQSEWMDWCEPRRAARRAHHAAGLGKIPPVYLNSIMKGKQKRKKLVCWRRQTNSLTK